MGNYVVRNRYVVSWIPEGDRWPAGIITGYDNGRGCFMLEWVVSFNSRQLEHLLKNGIGEAIRRGFAGISFTIPHEFPRGEALREVGESLGFRKLSSDHFETQFFRTVP